MHLFYCTFKKAEDKTLVFAVPHFAPSNFSLVSHENCSTEEDSLGSQKRYECDRKLYLWKLLFASEEAVEEQ